MRSVQPSSRALFDWGPNVNPGAVVGLGAALFVSIEVIALLTQTLSLRRLLVTLVVVAAASAACHALFVRRIGLRPRRGAGLLGVAAALQCAVIVGFVFGVTWWLPFVPALLVSWAPLGQNSRGWNAPRRSVQAVAVATLLGVGPVFSLGTTLVQPSADPMSLRTVEWLRLRGGEGVVNGVEHWWYSRHAPAKGGAPQIPISIAAPSITPPVADPSAAALPKSPLATAPRSGRPPTTDANTALIAVRPLVASPLPGEGQWTVVSGTAAHAAIAVTRVRPDAIHTSLVVGLARMDLSLVRIGLVAGTEDPGGTWPEGGQVPLSQRSALLAVFNSGFRQKEAGGGFWLGGRRATPLVDGAASLVVQKDGTATVAQWGRDASLGPDVVAVRQNLGLIVDDSAPVSGLDQGNNRRWGRTVGGKVLVWRSGIGVTKDGVLIYAGGPGMSIKTLADVLVAAGTVRAMELDINSAWVAYFLYQPSVNGPQGTKLLPGMRHPPTRYLRPQSRDFFTVVSR